MQSLDTFVDYKPCHGQRLLCVAQGHVHLREVEGWRQDGGQVGSLKVFSLAMFYSSTSNPEGRLSWLGLKVVLQLLQLFGDLLVQAFHFFFAFFLIIVTGSWYN